MLHDEGSFVENNPSLSDRVLHEFRCFMGRGRLWETTPPREIVFCLSFDASWGGVVCGKQPLLARSCFACNYLLRAYGIQMVS